MGQWNKLTGENRLAMKQTGNLELVVTYDADRECKPNQTADVKQPLGKENRHNSSFW